MFDIPKYGLVVDTENYAGNFERQLTAYCTGVVGDCNVGNREASDFRSDIGDELRNHLYHDLLYFKIDEHDCARPCSIWSTSGWFNNGVGGYFRDGQENEAEDHRNAYYEKNKMGGVKVPFSKYPAYLSVIVYFEKKPDNGFFEIFKTRAIEYCEKHEIKLTGFRWMEFDLQIKEHTI